jgi:hypothetical protein
VFRAALLGFSGPAGRDAVVGWQAVLPVSTEHASQSCCAVVCRPCCSRSVCAYQSVISIIVIITTSVLVEVIISMDEVQSGVVLIKCKYLCTQRLAIRDRLKLEEWSIHK